MDRAADGSRKLQERAMKPRDVVITGAGCLSPNGLDKAGFYDALCRGKSGIRAISRFDTDGLKCRIAGEVRGFDPSLWISHKDMPHVPLVVPYAVAASSEALADSGLSPGSLAEDLTLAERRRFGVVIGSGGGSVEWLERQYRQYFDKGTALSVYAVPSNTMGTLSSEVSMKFDLKGPSHVISTGCTSATDAIGYAWEHIRYGRADRMLCGGVDAPITPGTMAGFCLMKVVACDWNDAPHEGSRPFSADRGGFVLGEGAWMFLLEEKSHALARGARILAEIRGYGMTCDAYHRVRMDESGEEPARAVHLALADAGISPQAVSYINLHGTATPMNDRVETRAMHRALGSHAKRIPASSTKSMIGHPQGASGAAGLAATLFAMETGVLPPTLNLETPDPACDLDYVPEAGRTHDVDWAVCNCIGFGSKNSALVVRRGDS